MIVLAVGKNTRISLDSKNSTSRRFVTTKKRKPSLAWIRGTNLKISEQMQSKKNDQEDLDEEATPFFDVSKLMSKKDADRIEEGEIEEYGIEDLDEAEILPTETPTQARVPPPPESASSDVFTWARFSMEDHLQYKNFKQESAFGIFKQAYEKPFQKAFQQFYSEYEQKRRSERNQLNRIIRNRQSREKQLKKLAGEIHKFERNLTSIEIRDMAEEARFHLRELKQRDATLPMTQEEIVYAIQYNREFNMDTLVDLCAKTSKDELVGKVLDYLSHIPFSGSFVEERYLHFEDITPEQLIRLAETASEQLVSKFKSSLTAAWEKVHGVKPDNEAMRLPLSLAASKCWNAGVAHVIVKSLKEIGRDLVTLENVYNQQRRRKEYIERRKDRFTEEDIQRAMLQRDPFKTSDITLVEDAYLTDMDMPLDMMVTKLKQELEYFGLRTKKDDSPPTQILEKESRTTISNSLPLAFITRSAQLDPDPFGERKCVLKLLISALKLSQAAEERLIALVGKRYDSETGVLTLVADKHPTLAQNKYYVKQLLKSLLNESLKADESYLPHEEIPPYMDIEDLSFFDKPPLTRNGSDLEPILDKEEREERDRQAEALAQQQLSLFHIPIHSWAIAGTTTK